MRAFIFLFFVIGSITLCAQNIDSNSDNTEESFVVNPNNRNRSLLNSISNTVQSQRIQNTGVFLQQIGSYNQTNIETVGAETTDLKILQNGSNNDLDIRVEAQTVKGNINQVGNNNEVLDYNYGDYTSTSTLNVNQNGSNLKFKRYGTSEVANKLKFNMTGANRQIIVIGSGR